MPLTDRRQGFVKILRDRTAQHRSEEQLRENEERFRVLATSIPQLVFRSKPSGERTWGSPQWSVFTGLSLPDSLGLDVNLGKERAYPRADALRDRSVPFVFATGYDSWIIPEAYRALPRCEKPVDVRSLARLLIRSIK